MALVRIALGICVMWQAVEKGVNVFSGSGQDGFTFSYQFLDWIPYSPDYAELFAICWFISGFAFAAGIMFRVTAPICTLLTIYQYVIAADRYLNHEYMEIIFLILMSLGPSHHRLSIDRLKWHYSEFAPRFHLLTLQIQTEIILIYAGLVKINSDWLQLQPLSNWLIQIDDLSLIGTLWNQQWTIAIGAYGIILLHVFGAPLLFFKKTRAWIFSFYLLFHLLNSLIFPQIDIFPWMTIAVTTLFFEPDWPKRIIVRIYDRFRHVRTRLVDKCDQHLFKNQPGKMDSIVVLFFTVWLFFQVIIPMRPLLYPGPVAWTGEGNRFTWRMMLERKKCTSFIFVLYDEVSQLVLVPDIYSLVKPQKLKRICREPDNILRFAHHIKKRFVDRFKLSPDTRIQTVIMKSLNYRVASLYADPTVDLGNEELSLKHYSWILVNQKLNILPPPFKNFEKDSEVLDFHDLFQLTKIVGNYYCQPLNLHLENEGRGVFCKRQQYGIYE
jgi:vitamin K-dependent gamma-carboxylase